MLSAINYDPEFTWMDLSGFFACHLVLALLLGLAFRNHLNDVDSSWDFATCVGIWWVSQFLAGMIVWIDSWAVYQPFSLYSWIVLRRWLTHSLEFGGTILSCVLYVWTFQRRLGPFSRRRLLWTMIASAIADAIWQVVVGVFDLSEAIAFTFTDRGTWTYRLAEALSYSRLPGWPAAIGWVIWYVGLFGGKPISRSSAHDLDSHDPQIAGG